MFRVDVAPVGSDDVMESPSSSVRSAEGAPQPAERSTTISIGRNTGALHDVAPFVDIGSDGRAEFLWRAADAVETKSVELLLHLGRVHERDDLKVQFLTMAG